MGTSGDMYRMHKEEHSIGLAKEQGIFHKQIFHPFSFIFTTFM